MDWLLWVREVYGTGGTLWLNIQVVRGYAKIQTINSAAAEILQQKTEILRFNTFQLFL